ncbi:GntR family transcriptional regulator [Diaphorobacter sp.]|uniref:GntR family transcriptional regulator n=1 Tax=Diaphorobacter sp. TaxID=1934310 RepID=UPI0028AAF33D|nr:GntR family transcriptional regulator [Diaphorobacter sp.]
MSAVKPSKSLPARAPSVAKSKSAARAQAEPISQVRRERGSDVFQTLRDMAISYQLRPGVRLSEIELAARLGVSRTPVREALARLVTEGFLEPCTRGYMRRPLQVQDVLDLYEARMAVERECLRYAVERASEEQIAEMQSFLELSRTANPATRAQELVELDEAFHNRIAAMSGNAELARMLNNLNERVRFIRWIDMEKVGRDSTQKEHGAIADAIARRDTSAAATMMDDHIALRREQIVEAVTQGLARIFLADELAQMT